MGRLPILALLWVAFGGGIGYWIGSGKGRGGLGFALGLVFGWIGWIIVALLQPTAEVEALRMATIGAALRGDGAVFDLGRPCPWCAEIIKPAASVCRYCGGEVEPVPTPAIDLSARAFQSSVRVAQKHNSIDAKPVMIGTAIDVEDSFGFVQPAELDHSLRRRFRFAIESLGTLSSGEHVVGVTPVETEGIPGLLVLSDQRVLFFDESTGVLDIEFNRADAATSKSGYVVTIRDDDGTATFVADAPPRPASLVSSSSTHGTGVSAVRLCEDCGAEFTPAYVGNDCPDCGGPLAASETS